MGFRETKQKNYRLNPLLKLTLIFFSMYALYKLPSIIADKGFYIYNRFRGDTYK